VVLPGCSREREKPAVRQEPAVRRGETGSP